MLSYNINGELSRLLFIVAHRAWRAYGGCKQERAKLSNLRKELSRHLLISADTGGSPRDIKSRDLSEAANVEVSAAENVGPKIKS
jgi:hypothetical protein